jgi:hypothetical protein
LTNLNDPCGSIHIEFRWNSSLLGRGRGIFIMLSLEFE